ncbi:MAG: MGMT family protein [Clostridia bacterium]|nr:MGMT family protein [Clostridia bacterium]
MYELIYKALALIPKGNVVTYGQIARYIGNPRASRAVGWALRKNPQPFVIPCHRVVNRSGKLSAAFAFGGIDMQRELLLSEGVTVSDDYAVDLNKFGWEFPVQKGE